MPTIQKMSIIKSCIDCNWTTLIPTERHWVPFTPIDLHWSPPIATDPPNPTQPHSAPPTSTNPHWAKNDFPLSPSDPHWAPLSQKNTRWDPLSPTYSTEPHWAKIFSNRAQLCQQNAPPIPKLVKKRILWYYDVPVTSAKMVVTWW